VFGTHKYLKDHKNEKNRVSGIQRGAHDRAYWVHDRVSQCRTNVHGRATGAHGRARLTVHNF